MERYNSANHAPAAFYDDDNSGVRRLELERHKNDQKLKVSFEHIFHKYGHDYTGVGDEIDIISGEIVVNNGHLQYMRHEVDPGKSASSRFVRTFQEKLEEESDTVSDEEDDADEDEDEDEDEDDRSVDEDDHDSIQEEDSRLRPGTSGRLQQPRLPALQQAFGNLRRPAPRLARILIDEDTPQPPVDLTDSQNLDDHSSIDSGSEMSLPPSAMERHCPSIHGTVSSIKAKAKHPAANSEGDAIQALGVSIANQLAQLMAGPSKKNSRKEKKARSEASSRARSANVDPIWTYPELNDRVTRQKRRRSPSPQPLHPVSSPASRSPDQESLWAPEGSVRPPKRKRGGLLPSRHDETPVSSGLGRSLPPSPGSRSTRGKVRRCWNCSLTNSSSWQKGPHDQDLCQSCGKYYEVHRRMKPFDSPTPSADEEDISTDQQHASEIRVLPPHKPRGAATEPKTPHVIASDHERNGRMHRYEDNDATDAGSLWASEGLDAEARTHYSANTSRPLADTPSIGTKLPWPANEDALAVKLRDDANLSWPNVTSHYPDRSSHSIQQQYNGTLNHGQANGSELSWVHSGIQSNPAMDKGQHCRSDQPWYRGQDQLLLHLRDNRFLSWAEISNVLPDHTAEAIAERHRILLDAKLKGRQETPGQLSTEFTKEEDALIIRLKEVENLPWNLIIGHFPTRTMAALQERYASHLASLGGRFPSQPQAGQSSGGKEICLMPADMTLHAVEQVPFGPKEDSLIRELKERHNLDWKSIAAVLPNHSAIAVKYRYETIISKIQPANVGRETIPPEIALKQTPDCSAETSWRPIQLSKDHKGNHHGMFSVPATNLASPGTRHVPRVAINIRYPRIKFATPKTPQDMGRFKVKRESEEPTLSVNPAMESEPVNTIPHPQSLQSNFLARPGPGGRRPYTKAEDDLLLQMHSDGSLSWEDIASNLPGRSVRSIMDRYEKLVTTPGQSTPWRATGTPIDQNSNSHNRRSLPSTLSSRSNANPLLRKALDNSLRRRSDRLQNLQSAPDAEQLSRAIGPDAMQNAEVSRLMFREWQLSRDQPRQIAAAKASQIPHSVKKTAPVGNYAPLAVHQGSPNLIGSVGRAHHDDPSGRRPQTLVDIQRQLSQDDSLTASPTLLDTYTSETSGSETETVDDNEGHDDDFHPVGESCSPEKTLEPEDNPKTGGYSKRDHGARKAHSKRGKSRSSNSDIPTTSPRRTRSVTAKETSARQTLLPAFEVKPHRRRASTSSTSDDSLGDPERPDLSFSKLLRVAFGANDGRVMQCEDIFDWMESNYEFYRLSPPSWKARVRAELCANPSFSRTKTNDGIVAWQLVDSAKSDLSWGLTRGPRRKRAIGSKQDNLAPVAPPVSAINAAAVSATARGSLGFDAQDETGVSNPNLSDVSPDECEHGASRMTASSPCSGRSDDDEAHSRTPTKTSRPKEQKGTKPTAKGKKKAIKKVRISEGIVEIPGSDLDDIELTSDVGDDELLQPSSPLARIRPSSSDYNSTQQRSSRESKTNSQGSRRSSNVDLTKSPNSSSSGFQKPHTPASAYGKLRTPISSVSKLPSRGSWTRPRTPSAIFVSRSTPLPLPIRTRSHAETPIREVDSDEDELA